MKYTEEHEWLSLDGNIVTVGITRHAAEQLGDIVFVELPEVGAKVARGDQVCVIESVKAASDILSPLDGEITEVNETLPDNPGTVSDDPEQGGWFFKLKITDPAALDGYMDEAAYKELIG